MKFDCELLVLFTAALMILDCQFTCHHSCHPLVTLDCSGLDLQPPCDGVIRSETSFVVSSCTVSCVTVFSFFSQQVTAQLYRCLTFVNCYFFIGLAVPLGSICLVRSHYCNSPCHEYCAFCIAILSLYFSFLCWYLLIC